MKKILLTIVMCIFSIMINSASFSLELPKPKHCPSVFAINSSDFSASMGEIDDWIIFDPKNNFGLKEEWSFLMGIVNGNTLDEAKKNARNALLQARVIGPFTRTQGELWICMYVMDSGDHPMIGVACTPPEPFPSLKKLGSYWSSSR